MTRLNRIDWEARRWLLIASIVTMALLLTACGGGDADCSGLSDRETVDCLDIPAEDDAFKHPCDALRSSMVGFWARLDECGLDRGDLTLTHIPESHR